MSERLYTRAEVHAAFHRAHWEKFIIQADAKDIPWAVALRWSEVDHQLDKPPTGCNGFPFSPPLWPGRRPPPGHNFKPQ